MNKAILAAAFFLVHGYTMAQQPPASDKPATTGKPGKNVRSMPPEIKIPMQADRWDFSPEKCVFQEYKSVPSMHILVSGAVVLLKDFNFTDGTIEFDIQPEDPGFDGIHFRRQDKSEGEYFYLRVPAGGIPGSMVSVQYAPVIKGVNLWNMLPWYQGPASFKKEEWNHIKLVIAGAQMLVYVNDLVQPALEIPRLEGNTTQGGLGFDGKAVIANLVVKPGETEGLSPVAGFDPIYNDPRYIRQWTVSQPAPLPAGQELTTADLPNEQTVWTKITAERMGLVNLTRLFGSDKRRVVWLKCRLKSPEVQNRRVDFGFNNEVWIFLNGKLTMVDKNNFTATIRKEPAGRCSIENTSFTLPLKAGVNEVLIGIANDFYGWGVIARLDTMEGIEVLGD